MISSVVAAALCIKPRGLLTDRQARKVNALKDGSRAFAIMRGLAMRFNGIVRSTSLQALDEWIDDAIDTELTAKFEEYDLTANIAYSCDDTYSLVSLVSAGLGIGFAPEWTLDLPNRAFELKKVRGIDFRIGLGVAWNKDDPTASRDDVIDIARSRARPGR